MRCHGRQSLLAKTRILGLRPKNTATSKQNGLCGRRAHAAERPSHTQVPTPDLSCTIRTPVQHMIGLTRLILRRKHAVKIAQLALQSQSSAHRQPHIPKAVKGEAQTR